MIIPDSILCPMLRTIEAIFNVIIQNVHFWEASDSNSDALIVDISIIT